LITDQSVKLQKHRPVNSVRQDSEQRRLGKLDHRRSTVKRSANSPVNSISMKRGSLQVTATE